MVRLIKLDSNILYVKLYGWFWRRLNRNMNSQSVTFLFLVQLVGAIFYCVLLAAYVLPFPSTQVLIGDPTFKLLLTVFGGLFLLSTVASMAVSKLNKKA
jgi:hypothetical protein